MTDEESSPTVAPAAVLRFLALLLAIGVVAAAGAAILNTAVLLAQEGGTVELNASLDPPVVVERGGNRWEVEAMTTSGSIADPDAVGGLGGFSPQTVQGHVLIRPGDGPTVIYRLGLTVAGAIMVAGLLMLRRVVLSAWDGEPFARSNVRRFRIAGLCALALPAVGNATEWALINAVTVGSAVQLHPDLIPWWPFVLLAAGAFGLAEVFRAGSKLHDFEQLAI